MGNIVSKTNKPFRFLDLPPELRNEIYRLTLVHSRYRPTRRKATPALLRTCKQIYTEGIGVQHAESTFAVRIENLRRRRLEWSAVKVRGDIRHSSKFSPQSSSITHLLPLHLATVRRIHLHFEHSPFYENGVCTNAGRNSITYMALRDLASCLGTSRVRRTITCNFVAGLPNFSSPTLNLVNVEHMRLVEMFEPLYDLHTTTTITVESRPFPSVPRKWTRWLGGWAVRMAAANDAEKMQEARQAQAILERDVIPRLARRNL